jgi:hypothetical protein
MQQLEAILPPQCAAAVALLTRSLLELPREALLAQGLHERWLEVVFVHLLQAYQVQLLRLYVLEQ